MKNILLALILGVSFGSTSQIDGTEIGVDLVFGMQTGGVKSGTIGIGAKYGLKFGDYFILGPSARYHRGWTNNTTTGTSGGYNIFGGGAFVHGRFAQVLFAGVEFEYLRSPYGNSGIVTNVNPKWIPTCLVGGGFSKEFNESWRINAGVYYDILDIPNPTNPNNPNPNSPLQPYLTRRADGTIIPITYRIAFFFPLS